MPPWPSASVEGQAVVGGSPLVAVGLLDAGGHRVEDGRHPPRVLAVEQPGQVARVAADALAVGLAEAAPLLLAECGVDEGEPFRLLVPQVPAEAGGQSVDEPAEPFGAVVAVS